MEWTGLIIGFIFGIILQRGRVCFNSAFRDIFLMKDNYLMKLATFVLALETIFFLFFAQMGWITLNPKPLNWLGNILGGLIFGFGMVLAGGCASGTTYRVGEGMTTAWFAAIFYAIGATMTKSGALSGWVKWLSKFNVTVEHSSPLYVEKAGPTLATVFNVNPWVVGLIFAVILLIYTFATKTTPRSSKMGWKTAALLLAILAPFAWMASAATGRNYGLGITGGWIGLIKSATTGTKLSWEAIEIIGIIIGALVSALASKEFKLRMPKNPITYLQVMIGGLLMGFGAVTAGGCNVGHFLTGIPTLAISSLIAGVFFILGNWFMAWILYGR
ncbi:MAG: uncharacterized protein PWP37_1711 [Thermotogota bacterium]|nr:uncharacterized protein [Thermotogota bacterium]MDK2865519.1 uncharacterized protein [Thermotogota bacterium]HCZ06674.1 YeeE/YedE family protein [Thermotogota bacterium]